MQERQLQPEGEQYPAELAPCKREQHDLGKPHQARRALEEWHFDVEEADADNSQLTLYSLFFDCLHSQNVDRDLGLSRCTIRRFVEQLMVHRNPYPYHNVMHTTYVLQNVNLMMTKGGCLKGLAPDAACQPMLMFTMLVAACLHDAGHTGTSNDYLVKTEHELAVTHNDSSPLQNHHVSLGWRILTASGLLNPLKASSRSWLRRMLVNTILLTDLGKRVDVLSRAHTIVRKGISWSDDAALPVACALILKSADLGHAALPWPLHSKWAARLQEEMHMQGDDLKRRGFDVSPVHNRHMKLDNLVQIGFFKTLVMPLYEMLVEVFPECDTMLRAARENYRRYALQKTNLSKTLHPQQGSSTMERSHSWAPDMFKTSSRT